MSKPHTYYEILAVSSSASAIEIKKAYRKLALQFHPDRNPGSKKAEATKRFQEIGEAFECLSDSSRRSEYDLMLRQGGNSFSASSPFGESFDATASTTFRHPNSRVDPFTQFDHLFRTDPFFQEAFREMDEEFTKRFRNSNNDFNSKENYRPEQSSKKKSVEGWIPWLFRQCGVNFQMTTVVSDGSGRVSASRYSSTHRGSYTAKQTKSYVDSQGRRVVVHSMEQNGNQIQDTVINNQLAERKINGVVEKVDLIKNNNNDSTNE